jgi:regulator of cell morphogenesis and NO signaling
MQITEKSNVGALVANDCRLADVFKKFNIDFCCNGNRTLEDACLQKNISPSGLIRELTGQSDGPVNSSIQYNNWPIDLLADYIEKIHHRYVTEKIQSIRQYLDLIVGAHGDRHPELPRI